MIQIPLSKKEEEKLKELHRKYKGKKAADRIKAILLLNDGYSHEEICHILLINEDTLTLWKRRFLGRKSAEDWLEDNYGSNASKLTKKQKRKIIRYVKTHAITSSEQVIHFIEEKFAKHYSKSGIVSLLHELGFVYKQTTLIPSKFDFEKQQEFEKTYEALKQKLKPRETILFGDGVHPTHNTVTSRMWIKKGEQKLIKSNTGRKRLNINGVYNPLTQKVLVKDSETINAQTTIEFFKKVETFYENQCKIYLFVDNARYYRSKLVQEFLKTSKIEIHFLPPYSPNLNLIERLWKFMRKKAIDPYYYEKFDDFRSAVLGFFDHLDQLKPELSSFIGTKLHLLKKPISVLN